MSIVPRRELLPRQHINFNSIIDMVFDWTVVPCEICVDVYWLSLADSSDWVVNRCLLVFPSLALSLWSVAVLGIAFSFSVR